MCEVADTPGQVEEKNQLKTCELGFYTEQVYTKIQAKGGHEMSNIVRIKLKAYDHRVLDNAATKIVETVKRTGGEISGPVPLPTEIQKYTILRAVHKYKDSREQFEMRTHKRLIDIKNPSKETIDALTHLDIPSGVDIKIKLQQEEEKMKGIL